MTEQLTKPKDEIQTVNPDNVFDMQIKTLLYYQNRVENIANVATRFLAEARNKYNHFLQLYKPALEAYAKDHLKRGADGEIKGKSYKSISAGGGVFFRAKSAKITLTESKLNDLREFILGQNPEATDLINMKISWEVPDKQALVDILQEIAEKRAKEILANPEEITVGQVAGLQEIFNEFGIEIEEEDPFYYLRVGTTKGWTGNNLKANLSQAIEGSFKLEQEDEIDLLLEDLGHGE